MSFLSTWTTYVFTEVEVEMFRPYCHWTQKCFGVFLAALTQLSTEWLRRKSKAFKGRVYWCKVP